jgi:hypothetical protein
VSAPDIAALAETLTEAQVNLLFYWPKGLFDEGTRRALARKGLIEGRTVTPRGLAVRQHLERTK